MEDSFSIWIVTEPTFHSADEAVSFLETMRNIYQYAGISEADSKKGQVRCDVNVSIMDIDLDNKDSKASFDLHLAAREYNQN